MNAPPTWHLRLYGTPCVNCGQPAERLLVFPTGRLVTHAPTGGPPCRLADPVDPEFLMTAFAQRRAA